MSNKNDQPKPRKYGAFSDGPRARAARSPEQPVRSTVPEIKDGYPQRSFKSEPTTRVHLSPFGGTDFWDVCEDGTLRNCDNTPVADFWLTDWHRDRAASCVNACAGLADPEKEIRDLREQIAEARTVLGAKGDEKLVEICKRWRETAEILAIPGMLDALRKSEADARAGKFITAEKLFRELLEEEADHGA